MHRSGTTPLAWSPSLRARLATAQAVEYLPHAVVRLRVYLELARESGDRARGSNPRSRASHGASTSTRPTAHALVGRRARRGQARQRRAAGISGPNWAWRRQSADAPGTVIP